MSTELNGISGRLTPPYVSFSTFITFLNHLRDTVVPDKIDPAVMRKIGGTQRPQILAALRFFDWMEGEECVPTAEMRTFVEANDEARKRLFLKKVKECYPLVFADDVNLKSITVDGLEKRIAPDLKGDTLRKAYTFFATAADYIGIEIGPHAKKSRGRRTGTRNRRAKRTPSTTANTEPADSAAQEVSESWNKMLLEKFPTFDPSWPDDLKKSWFNGFEMFMSLNKLSKEKQIDQESDL